MTTFTAHDQDIPTIPGVTPEQAETGLVRAASMSGYDAAHLGEFVKALNTLARNHHVEIAPSGFTVIEAGTAEVPMTFALVGNYHDGYHLEEVRA